MKTYADGVNACLAVIEKKMNALRAPETRNYIDPPSGRTETIVKGEWLGSALLKEV